MAIILPQAKLSDRILQLTIERLDAIKRKKASNRVYTEEIKRIDDEIKEALEQENAADVEKIDVE